MTEPPAPPPRRAAQPYPGAPPDQAAQRVGVERQAAQRVGAQRQGGQGASAERHASAQRQGVQRPAAQRQGPRPAQSARPRRSQGGRPGRTRRNATARVPAAVYVIVLAGSAAGLAWIWHGGSHSVKGGTLAVAGAMFVAALARLVLPEGRAGMLASRKRFTDVITLAALAAGLLAVGLVLPAPL